MMCPARTCCPASLQTCAGDFRCMKFGGFCRRSTLEEDKRATTNVQNGLVFFFYYLFKEALILRQVWGKISEKV